MPSEVTKRPPRIVACSFDELFCQYAPAETSGEAVSAPVVDGNALGMDTTGLLCLFRSRLLSKSKALVRTSEVASLWSALRFTRIALTELACCAVASVSNIMELGWMPFVLSKPKPLLLEVASVLICPAI